MILDSSAIVAVLLREPGCQVVLEKLLRQESMAVGAPTAFEAAMVLSIKLHRDGQSLLHDFLLETKMAVVPFTQDHVSCAMEAYSRFGKGRHEAGLNFGDCLAYATAKLAGQPLLFQGDEFTKTDIVVA